MLSPHAAAFDLKFTGGKTLHGTLHCEPVNPLVVRVELLSPARSEEQAHATATATVGVTVGKVRSRWTGALDEIRGCAARATGDRPSIQLDLPGDPAVTCRLAPETRTVALDATALAPGSVLPDAQTTFAAACLGTAGGNLELTSSTDRIVANLPANLPIKHVFVPWRGVGRASVEPRCKPGQQLRTMTMRVADDPRFELGAMRVDRLGDGLGVTCDPPGKVRDARRFCELSETELHCDPAPPPREPVDCRYDRQAYLHAHYDCASCRPLSLTDDLRNDTAHRGYTCRSVCKCE
jgi:hypothetical protein